MTTVVACIPPDDMLIVVRRELRRVTCLVETPLYWSD